jgi:hypothetical protein
MLQFCEFMDRIEEEKHIMANRKWICLYCIKEDKIIAKKYTKSTKNTLTKKDDRYKMTVNKGRKEEFYGFYCQPYGRDRKGGKRSCYKGGGTEKRTGN